MDYASHATSYTLTPARHVHVMHTSTSCTHHANLPFISSPPPPTSQAHLHLHLKHNSTYISSTTPPTSQAHLYLHLKHNSTYISSTPSPTSQAHLHLHLKHTSVSNKPPSQTHLHLKHTSISNTPPSQTNLRLKHTSVSNTPPSQTHLKHTSVSNTPPSQTHLHLKHTSISPIVVSYVYMTLQGRRDIMAGPQPEVEHKLMYQTRISIDLQFHMQDRYQRQSCPYGHRAASAAHGLLRKAHTYTSRKMPYMDMGAVRATVIPCQHLMNTSPVQSAVCSG